MVLHESKFLTSKSSSSISLSSTYSSSIVRDDSPYHHTSYRGGINSTSSSYLPEETNLQRTCIPGVSSFNKGYPNDYSVQYNNVSGFYTYDDYHVPKYHSRRHLDHLPLQIIRDVNPVQQLHPYEYFNYDKKLNASDIDYRTYQHQYPICCSEDCTTPTIFDGLNEVQVPASSSCCAHIAVSVERVVTDLNSSKEAYVIIEDDDFVSDCENKSKNAVSPKRVKSVRFWDENTISSEDETVQCTYHYFEKNASSASQHAALYYTAADIQEMRYNAKVDGHILCFEEYNIVDDLLDLMTSTQSQPSTNTKRDETAAVDDEESKHDIHSIIHHRDCTDVVDAEEEKRNDFDPDKSTSELLCVCYTVVDHDTTKNGRTGTTKTNSTSTTMMKQCCYLKFGTVLNWCRSDMARGLEHKISNHMITHRKRVVSSTVYCYKQLLNLERLSSFNKLDSVNDIDELVRQYSMEYTAECRTFAIQLAMGDMLAVYS